IYFFSLLSTSLPNILPNSKPPAAHSPFQPIPPQKKKSLIKDNSSLDGTLVLHSLQALAPLLQLVGLVDNAVHLDLATVQVGNGGGEHVSLREGAENGDFVADCLVRKLLASSNVLFLFFKR